MACQSAKNQFASLFRSFNFLLKHFSDSLIPYLPNSCEATTMKSDYGMYFNIPVVIREAVKDEPINLWRYSNLNSHQFSWRRDVPR